MNHKRVAIIGGGAAGYFFAINAAILNPKKEFTIYEQAKHGLQKVKISGGGRCNLTHSCFDPKELIKNYPRGERELFGPFHRFGPQDTINWFNKRGVETKTETDGRMFPKSNQSQSIIDCLTSQCDTYGIKEVFSQKLLNISPIDEGEKGFTLHFKEKKEHVDQIMFTTGSSKMVWKLLESIGYQIVDAVPSLFTFQIKDKRIEHLAGISLTNATIKLEGTQWEMG